ncbi:hypothetical protein BC937DRAFT_87415 [Endogone sp. FLAS-F59071]|nr:hypothetical protein BC937DRAFT_87415 [Endogone sp. FLAS-F59071]|eukprot:RUS19468.1 hypothetical protein BC937DRAFT_87415 [Endogone sp. FLAS-F59071]
MKSLFILLVFIAGIFASPILVRDPSFHISSPTSPVTWDVSSTQEITFWSNEYNSEIVKVFLVSWTSHVVVITLSDGVSVGTGVVTFNVPCDIAGREFYVHIVGININAKTDKITIAPNGGCGSSHTHGSVDKSSDDSHADSSDDHHEPTDPHKTDDHNDDSHKDDSHKDDSHKDDSHKDDSHKDDSHKDDSHKDDSHKDDSHKDDSHKDDSHTDDSHTDDSHKDDSHKDDSHKDDSHKDDSHKDDSHKDDSHEPKTDPGHDESHKDDKDPHSH